MQRAVLVAAVLTAAVLTAVRAPALSGQQATAEMTVTVRIPPMVRLDAVALEAASVPGGVTAFHVVSNASWEVELLLDPVAGCVVELPAGVHEVPAPASAEAPTEPSPAAGETGPAAREIRRLAGARGRHEPIRVACARPGEAVLARVVVAHP